ncbi:hypothetical protein MLD38_031731 [Melastoma candidum]|uniref:Uncharacterized protein n=1 Tax=Melastoma candidum TaxID=119954 RepID=A0ACB9MQ20_9MYRT|nr:hypothetical protein MLD38_031731 [Melastoma candidum]
MGTPADGGSFFGEEIGAVLPGQLTESKDLFAVALDQPFRFPSTFTFVLRAFTTLEGIGYALVLSLV